jgi:hypothetical protein
VKNPFVDQAKLAATAVLLPAGFLMLLLLAHLPTSGLDYVLLSLLVILVALAVIRRDRVWFRIITVLIFVGTVFLCILSLSAFVPRYASTTTNWSEAFRDGISRTMDCARPYFPYILISSTGLALLAILGPKKVSNINSQSPRAQTDHYQPPAR